MSIINNCYLISAPNNFDRREVILPVLKDMGINIINTISIDVEHSEPINGELTYGSACTSSHSQAISDFLQSNEETIFMIEDDCMFLRDINTIKDIISTLPNDWDVCYLGGLNHTLTPEYFNSNWIKCRHAYNSHAYILKREAAEILLKSFNKNQYVCDICTANLQIELNMYSPTTDLAWQNTIFGNKFHISIFDKQFNEYKSLKSKGLAERYYIVNII